MKDLDKTKIYDLKPLSKEERETVHNWLKVNDKNYKYTSFFWFNEKINNCDGFGFSGTYKEWLFSRVDTISINAKELFYTLENVQVDCIELTEGQVKEMCKVYKGNGYKPWIDEDAFKIIDNYTYLSISLGNEFHVTGESDTKTTITYEKFMELFGYKEKSEEFKDLVEVLNKELAEEYNKQQKPQQYQIGIDTFNPQPHYNNENGSLYKIATDLGLNHWEFDIFKRLVRCRKKNQFKEDLQKIKDTIDIYLNEYSG